MGTNGKKASAGDFQEYWNASLNAIREAAKQAAGDSIEALNAVEAFVAGLGDDTAELVTAAGQAAATGSDTSTWLEALNAQVEAVGLRTLRAEGALSQREADRILGIAVGALHTAVMLGIALA